tara:strand:+ start:1202 stop:2032 length:831 start_codon:yes stop_codon:yes gene_type:complete
VETSKFLGLEKLQRYSARSLKFQKLSLDARTRTIPNDRNATMKCTLCSPVIVLITLSTAGALSICQGSSGPSGGDAITVTVGNRTKPEFNSTRLLRYDRPAEQWTEALPVGNGRLGAMVFGGIHSELLQLNEATLWSGGPSEWNNPGAKAALAQVREALFAGDYTTADELCRKMQGPFNQSYQPLGDLKLSFLHEGEPTGYERYLDLDSAVTGMRYQIGCSDSGGVKYFPVAILPVVDKSKDTNIKPRIRRGVLMCCVIGSLNCFAIVLEDSISTH